MRSAAARALLRRSWSRRLSRHVPETPAAVAVWELAESYCGGTAEQQAAKTGCTAALVAPERRPVPEAGDGRREAVRMRKPHACNERK